MLSIVCVMLCVLSVMCWGVACVYVCGVCVGYDVGVDVVSVRCSVCVECGVYGVKCM